MDFDAIVIGAGVIGSATTFELARRGHHVLCVDAGPGAGMGSTSSSSAIIRYNYSTFDGVLTAWEAAACWRALGDHLGGPSSAVLARFVPCELVMLDHPGSNQQTVFQHFDAIGIPYETLTPDELTARIPAIDTADLSPPKAIDDPAFGQPAGGRIGGFVMTEAGFIDDPMLAAQNFMDAAIANGATLRLGAEVGAIVRALDRVGGVELADGERIESPVVVNAAGPASARMNRLAGVIGEMTIGHRPLRQEVHVVPAPEGFRLDDGGVMVADIGTGTYFRPHLGRTILVGSTEPDCDPLEWVDDPDDFNDRPSVDWFQRNTLRLASRIPSVGIPLRPAGLAALYDASDDWVPIYDRTGLGGYFMACGTSGNQFKNAPLVGVFMAELIEAAAGGHDHDREPVQVIGPKTGQPINLGAYSRRRSPTVTAGNVLG
ncbi:MAG: FAD-binding oxidoreductase [Actinomycetia bacterium]|nr:FAD-binding oxidoreductase [Actinomycetes bacterium]MCP5031255.1 FAD-binding oxidoreductase [Actinomycetes bacterium]